MSKWTGSSLWRSGGKAKIRKRITGNNSYLSIKAQCVGHTLCLLICLLLCLRECGQKWLWGFPRGLWNREEDLLDSELMLNKNTPPAKVYPPTPLWLEEIDRQCCLCYVYEHRFWGNLKAREKSQFFTLLVTGFIEWQAGWSKQSRRHALVIKCNHYNLRQPLSRMTM
jgi:hypothetical protein